jgi:SOUL heme-binding protein
MTTLDLPIHASLTPSEDAPVNAGRDELAIRARRMRWAGRVSLAVPVLGAATGAWLLSRGAKRRSAGLGALGASLGLALVRWQLQRLVTENVAYEVRATLGDIELRNYPPQVWAETVVEQATWSGALNEGFRRLAGYIFGNNAATARLSMTAPVLSSLSSAAPPRAGEKLAMTAPVLATLGDDGQVADRTVSFVMPADRKLRDLPAPRDPRVRLRPVPPRLVAALAFRGNYESSLPQRKQDELLRLLREAGIRSRGEVTFAGYDPPSTLPSLRRNEVMVQLAEPGDVSP